MWLVVMMIVCEHKAHFWSISCPSFFTLLRCPLRPYTYTHTPSHHQLRALIRIFFSTRIRARKLPGTKQNARALVFFFSFSLVFPSFVFLLLLCYATLWSTATSSKFATTTTTFQRIRGKKIRIQNWHIRHYYI